MAISKCKDANFCLLSRGFGSLTPVQILLFPEAKYKWIGMMALIWELIYMTVLNFTVSKSNYFVNSPQAAKLNFEKYLTNKNKF